MLRRIRRAVACMLVLVLFAGAVGRTEEALVADVTEGALAFAKEIVFEEEEAADLAEVPEVELPAAAEENSIEEELPMKGSEEELISVPEADSVEEAPVEESWEDSVGEAPTEGSEAESVEASPDEANASEMEEHCAMPLMLGMARTVGNNLESAFYYNEAGHLSGYDYNYEDTVVNIPPEVTSIGNDVFADCIGIERIIIPNGVHSIGSWAFANCSSLTSVVIPESVTSIADDAFFGCGSFTATVDKGSYAHEYCKENQIPFRYNCRQTDDGIQYIVKEGAITVIGYAGSGVNLKIPGALDGLPVTKVEIETNLNVQILELPGSLQQIPESAFAGWKALRSVSLSEGIQRIGASAFSGCSALQSISLPYSLTEFGSGVFANCGTLTAAVYKNSSAHTYCTDAKISCKIVHFETADGFQYDLFGNVATIVGYDEKLTDVVVPEKIGENTVAYVEDGVFRGKTQLRSIVFPADVILTMGSRGFFAGCTALESVTLPNTTISCSINFSGCTQLKNIYVSAGNPNWKSTDGVLYDKSGETLIYFPPGRSGSFDVPEGVSKIAAGAFSGSALSRVKLHSGISEIGENAFAGTKNFRAVVKEGSYALRYCFNNGIAYQLLTQSVQLSDTHIRAELSEKELYLNATVLPASAGQELEWSSDKPSVAAVEDGNVTLHSVGRTVITCRTMDGSGVFAQCVIEVAQSVASTRISLDRESLSLTLDSDPVRLIASVSDDSEVTWTSSAPEVATVVDGLITPVGGGVALVRCSAGGASAQCIVIVDGKRAVRGIRLNHEKATLDLAEDEVLNLTAMITPENATNKAVTWSSSDSSVALVGSDGAVHPRKVGTATISCTAADGSGAHAECEIEVINSAANTKITLSETSLQLKSGETRTLTYEVVPETSVTWTSSNPAVASVSNGKITALGAGIALITCTASNGSGASASCLVTVSDRTPVSAITLNHSSATLDLAEDEILTLTATITPDNATNKAVTWSSSDSSVALVGSDGTVHPRKVGRATISCTAADGSGVHAECEIEVINSAANTTVTLSETSIQLKSGEIKTLTCTVVPETSVTWTSSNSAVASVSNGEITALGAGVALISCTANNGSGASASCLVTVSDRTPVSAITLNHSSKTLDLAKNEILTLTATITPDNATNKAVTWSSSDSSVALVGSDGMVHPRKVGTATISCTAADGSGAHAECVVEVINSAANTTVTLSETSLQLKSGETKTLTYEAVPETDVTWTSSNPAVASVQNGKVTSLGAGVALITCTASNGSGASASCLVTVSDRTQVAAIRLNHESATLDLVEDEILTLTATITPDDATNKTVTWSSSDSSVALVGSDGTVHPRKVGTATISCSAADGSGVHVECTVEVINSAANTKITLSETSIQLKSGETKTLTCTVVPETSVTWTSSNSAVASVQDGKVTALGAGVALITCTASNGSGASASCLVTVDGSVPVTSVTLNRTSATLNRAENEMLALQASVLPANASNPQLRWSSSDPAVAAVTASGVVIPMGAGKAIITAAALDGSGKEASCSVTVREQVKPTAVELTPPAVTLNLASGEKCALTAKIVPANASYGGFRWSSSDADIARVSAGVVTPVSAGIAVISCAADGTAGVQASCIVTVVNSVSVRAIELSEAELRLSVGEAHALYAKILPENADDGSVVWSSSDEDVAFVASNGTVVARSAGTALVSCASAGNASVRASCRVTVTNRAAVQEIVLNRENLTLNIAAGEVCALTATLKPEGAGGEVVWSSTNEAVAVVTGDGLVVPLAEGSASIVCTSAENSAVRAVCELRVVRSKLPTNIILFENDVKLDWSTGESRYLQSILLPSDATERALVWHSSNEAVARVEDGVVTPVFVGSAVISCALAADSSVRAACTVQVYASREPDDLHIIGQERQSLLLGESMQLGAQLVPANSYSDVKWSSSDETIASVDESGRVTALKEVEAQITAAAENGAADAVRFEIVDPSMPTGVELSGESLSLGAGERIHLEARVLPETAVAELIWESSDAKIAKVDASGGVRGVKKGEAELRVTAVGADGRRFCDEMKLEVRYAPAEVKLNQKRLLLYVGGEGAQLGASVGAKCASALAWSSSDEAVAAVDEDGMIEPIAPGSAVIRCKTFNGKSAKCAVTVSPMPEGIELEEAELRMYPRQSRRLRAQLVDGSGAVCVGEISYASSHPERVSVSADGRLTAETAAPGTAEILLTGPNGLTAQVHVTVCRAPERVELPEARIELGVGEEYQLYPIIGEDEATQFSFASGNRRVASVDGDGLITAKRVGTAKITVRTHNKKYASLTVRVSAD